MTLAVLCVFFPSCVRLFSYKSLDKLRVVWVPVTPLQAEGSLTSQRAILMLWLTSTYVLHTKCVTHWIPLVSPTFYFPSEMW